MTNHHGYLPHYHAYEIKAMETDKANYESSISFNSALHMVGISNYVLAQNPFFRRSHRNKLQIVAKTILRVATLLSAKTVEIRLQPHHNIERSGDEAVVIFLDSKGNKIRWFTLGVLWTAHGLFIDLEPIIIQNLIENYLLLFPSVSVPKSDKKVRRGHAYIDQKSIYRFDFWADSSKPEIKLVLTKKRAPIREANTKMIDFTDLK